MKEKQTDTKIKVKFRANYQHYTYLEVYELTIEEALPFIRLGIAEETKE